MEENFDEWITKVCLEESIEISDAEERGNKSCKTGETVDEDAQEYYAGNDDSGVLDFFAHLYVSVIGNGDFYSRNLGLPT